MLILVYQPVLKVLLAILFIILVKIVIIYAKHVMVQILIIA